MPRDYLLENWLEKAMQQLNEAQDKKNKTFNDKIDKMKVQFSDKLDAINQWALKIEEEVQ